VISVRYLLPLAVLLLNWLFRLGAEGDKERIAEEEAREHYARTGHWPDEDEA
jgi:hypothetical protein